MSGPGVDFATALFRKSVLKQAKYQQIVALLGDTTGLECLDVAGDNGVVSLMLRKRGGAWHSADLDPGTVESIRQLGDGVVQIDGRRTPFPDGSFDRIVIIDFLEQITHRPRVCQGAAENPAADWGVDRQRAEPEAALLAEPFPAHHHRSLWFFSRLDHLLFLQEGYKLIVRAQVNSESFQDRAQG